MSESVDGVEAQLDEKWFVLVLLNEVARFLPEDLCGKPLGPNPCFIFPKPTGVVAVSAPSGGFNGCLFCGFQFVVMQEVVFAAMGKTIEVIKAMVVGEIPVFGIPVTASIVRLSDIGSGVAGCFQFFCRRRCGSSACSCPRAGRSRSRGRGRGRWRGPGPRA